MSGNSIGKLLTLTSFGESHGTAIGGVLDGMPPGIYCDIPFIQGCLDKRRPGTHPLHTQRLESDTVQILSGVFENHTTGAPIGFIIHNTDQRSTDYSNVQHVLRPGHGDYSYFGKYGIYDHRGGGRASARETAVRIVGGGFASLMLKSILSTQVMVRGCVIQIGTHSINLDQWNWDSLRANSYFCPDLSVIPLWESALNHAKENGQSLGARIYVEAIGIPKGLGEPVYDKLDADLAKAFMSINAVKGVEIGDGFECVSAPVGFDEMSGSDDTKDFLSNRAGGILAGISTGQPIVCRVGIKPTSSTNTPRQALTHTGEEVSISIGGRHDPCVGLRAVPIVEAMMALVLGDHLLRFRGQCNPKF